MKDIHTVQHGVEIIVFGTEQGDGRIITVIQYVGTAHVGAVFRIIDAHAANFGEKNFGRIDADSGQLALEGACDRIVRQSRQIAGIAAEHGKRCADVGLTAAICRF